MKIAKTLLRASYPVLGSLPGSWQDWLEKKFGWEYFSPDDAAFASCASEFLLSGAAALKATSMDGGEIGGAALAVLGFYAMFDSLYRATKPNGENRCPGSLAADALGDIGEWAFNHEKWVRKREPKETALYKEFDVEAGGDTYRVREYKETGERACWLHSKGWASEDAEMYAAWGGNFPRGLRRYDRVAESIAVDPGTYPASETAKNIALGSDGLWDLCRNVWNSSYDGAYPLPRLATAALLFTLALPAYLFPEEAPKEGFARFPDRLALRLEGGFQPVKGPGLRDSLHTGVVVQGIGKDGKPIFGDVFRLYYDETPKGTERTNAGLRVPFSSSGYKGDAVFYGFDTDFGDSGFGGRVDGACNKDWLFGAVGESATISGLDKTLGGLGIGRIFHPGIGDTRVELWGYDRSGEAIGSIFVLQNLPEGFKAGFSFKEKEYGNRNFSAAVERQSGDFVWRAHGSAALDGENYSGGVWFSIGSDPMYLAPKAYGFLNQFDGRANEGLWDNAMRFYPTIKPHESGVVFGQVDFAHNQTSENVSASISVKPFALHGADSWLLRGIHLDGGYGWRRLESKGHKLYGDGFTYGAGFGRRGFDFSVSKPEGEEPAVFLRFTKQF